MAKLTLRRCAWLSPRASRVGAALLAVMVLFCTIGGLLSPYDESQIFFQEEETSRDQAQAQLNGQLRFTAADGQALPGSVQRACLRAVAAGEHSFVVEQQEYTLIDAGGFYLIATAAGQSVGLAAELAWLPLSAGEEAGFSAQLSARQALSAGQAGFTLDGREYRFAPQGTYTLICTADGQPWALLTRQLVAGADGAALSDEFVLQAQAALASGAETMQADGAEFRLSYSGDSCAISSYSLSRRTLALSPPSWEHPLGTDENGMDVLCRLMYGGRVSLTLALLSTVLALALGVILGSLAGYCGGWLDSLVMRTVDVFNCLPVLPLVIVLGALLDSQRAPAQLRLVYLLLILALFSWPPLARLARGQVLSLREQDFMAASRLLGCGPWRALRRHILPNILPQLAVFAALGLGDVILSESVLSFLGVGVKYPYASWGNMINAVNSIHVLTHYWFVWIPAGCCILWTVLALHLLADGLSDSLDPRRRSAARPAPALAAPTPVPALPAERLLEIDGLSLDYVTAGQRCPALQQVSLSVPAGQCLGLMGESGCGKSSLALSLLGLLPNNAQLSAGSIRFAAPDGLCDLARLDEAGWQRIRGKQIGLVFQEPQSSLDPVMTIGRQLDEVLRTLSPQVKRQQRQQQRERLLRQVGLDDVRRISRSYPHQLSGGTRQRAVIALALAAQPRLLVADEPTANLDAISQAQIIDLLARLQQELGLSLLLVSHDPRVIASLAQQVVVLRQGRVVESGPARQLFSAPAEDYTRRLLQAVQ